MTIEIRILGPEDLALVCGAPAGVFDQPPQEHLAAEFLSDSRHHLAAAIDDGRMIGFVSALHYVHPDKAAELWINEVGVAAEHRGRGIGRRLLEAILAHGRELGCGNAWVLTEGSNVPAMKLYSGAGGAQNSAALVMFEFDVDRSVDGGAAGK